MRKLVVLAVLCWSTSLMAAGPGCGSAEPPLVFRAQAAEVHLTFTAVGDHNQVVTELSSQDFKVLRDGALVEGITGFESLQDAPLSLVVLADVSQSMQKMLPVENTAKAYLSRGAAWERDRVSFLDFGGTVHPAGLPGSSNAHLTSMFDSALDVVLHRTIGNRRHAVLLISDGGDNYSLHTVDDVIAAAQRNDVAFYVLHIDEWRETDGQALRTLAEKTGGRYFLVEKKTQILPIMQDIETELRNTFLVTFRTDGTRNGVHQLAIKATDKKLKFFHRTTYYQPGSAQSPHSEQNLATIATR